MLNVAQGLFKAFVPGTNESSQDSLEVDTVDEAILWMSGLRPTEVREHIWGHTANVAETSCRFQQSGHKAHTLY